MPLPPTVTGVKSDIWRTSARTLRLCMYEHYEDCPWREQAMYANDFNINNCSRQVVVQNEYHFVMPQENFILGL